MTAQPDDSVFAPVEKWLAELDRLRAAVRAGNGEAASRLNFLLSHPPPEFAEVLARRVVSLIKTTELLESEVGFLRRKLTGGI